MRLGLKWPMLPFPTSHTKNVVVVGRRQKLVYRLHNTKFRTREKGNWKIIDHDGLMGSQYRMAHRGYGTLHLFAS
jgi:hypothetical protein